MIDKTDSSISTKFSTAILDILAVDERADGYEVIEYLPELSYERMACIESYDVGETWTHFMAVDLETDESGVLCYSSEDRLEFRSKRYVLNRLKRSNTKKG